MFGIVGASRDHASGFRPLAMLCGVLRLLGCRVQFLPGSKGLSLGFRISGSEFKFRDSGLLV